MQSKAKGNNMAKTNNELIGELAHEIAAIESLIEAHNEPLKDQIKSKKKQVKRLLLEDGRQTVDLTLLEGMG